MGVNIKVKTAIFLSILVIFILSIISAFATSKSTPVVCSEINKKISMCDFYVYSRQQKKVCIKNVIKQYRKTIVNDCR
jgi:hypothetical protein